jgi:hypothetical protein
MHTYAGVKTEDHGLCDDTFCTGGHVSRTVHCSCGWFEQTYADWDSEWQAQFAWTQHALSEICRAAQAAPISSSGVAGGGGGT